MESKSNTIFFISPNQLFVFLKILFIYFTERENKQEEQQAEGEGEGASPLSRELNMGLYPRTLGL